jgi:hypothetical protein
MAKMSRFQLDLTADEMSAIERWSKFAGFRTKREFLLNALTLFEWAAKQVMLGRTISAINEATGEVRHLELPALTAIAARTPALALTAEEVQRRLAEPRRPLAEILAELNGSVGEEALHRDHEPKRRKRVGAIASRPSRPAPRNRRTV